ncbi:MAG TPA: amidohydrolase family protein, partial [Ktedonobacterales bacterium]|nr:amidohydrolase family protein [Ktedonobacterales bacterium]
GVRGGHFSLNRWIELCCTNPAKLFGIYPQKGVIAPGADADVVVWDPETTHTISVKTHHQNTDYNLYEGMKVTGVPSIVLLRGNIIVQNGEWKGSAGSGRFLKRQRFGEAATGAKSDRAAATRATAGTKGR